MKFQLYKDRSNEWRWRLKARNGRTLADSGEGYKRSSAATKAIDNIACHFGFAYDLEIHIRGSRLTIRKQAGR